MDFDKAFLNSIVNAICTEFLDDIAYALVHDQVVKISSAEIETIGMCDIVMARWTGYEDNNNFVIIVSIPNRKVRKWTMPSTLCPLNGFNP